MTKDVVIGKIIGTHGRRGMVKIFPLSDYPDRFMDMDKMTLEKGGVHRDYTVAEIKKHQKYFLIKFQQVADMNEADNLKGSLIKVSREELVPLPEGSFYVFDIIGLKVYTEDGGYIGEVENVLQTGANDVYVVGTNDKPLLIPAIKEVVKEINIVDRKMVIVPQRE